MQDSEWGVECGVEGQEDRLHHQQHNFLIQASTALRHDKDGSRSFVPYL